MLSTANAIVDAKERTQPMRKDTHASLHRRHVDSARFIQTRLPQCRQWSAAAVFVKQVRPVDVVED